jgi:hypothetical protein
VREITLVARDGGGDPAGNPRLRLLMDKAKEINMPQENIMRAMKEMLDQVEYTYNMRPRKILNFLTLLSSLCPLHQIAPAMKATV